MKKKKKNLYKHTYQSTWHKSYSVNASLLPPHISLQIPKSPKVFTVIPKQGKDRITPGDG